MLNRWALMVGLLVLAPWTAGAQSAPPVPADFQGTGVILAILPPPSSLHKTRPVLVIQHDAIPGLMDDAMTMPFLAASVDLFRGLQPGDRITFDLQSAPDALLVIHIERRGPRP